MRVISMTREDIYQLPYNERENIIKLVRGMRFRVFSSS